MTRTDSSFRKDLSKFWTSFCSYARSSADLLRSSVGGKLYYLTATSVPSQAPLYTLLKDPVPICSSIFKSSKGIHYAVSSTTTYHILFLSQFEE